MAEIVYQPEHDYYELFGVSPGASVEEIARAHKRLAKECHPDLHPDKDWATERFKEINHAYGILKDPETKALYDRLRWSEVGGHKTRPAREKKHFTLRPKRSAANTVDPEQHHRDRYITYTIWVIEVLVIGLFLVLGVVQTIRKLGR